MHKINWVSNYFFNCLGYILWRSRHISLFQKHIIDGLKESHAAQE